MCLEFDWIPTLEQNSISFMILFELCQTVKSDWNCIQLDWQFVAPSCTSAPAAFPLQHLQQASTSAEGTTQGKSTVLLFTFHPCSPLTHGCYRSELSTNQLSTHICSMSTVCLLFSVLVSPRIKEWTLRGLNQPVISRRTDCLFFHCLCPSDKQAWVLTYDPFN